MFDFTKHLNVGLAAAEAAERNRAEIDGVFQELNKQLHDVTSGKVQIDRYDFHESWKFTKDFRPLTYSGLAVFSPISEGSPKEIAKWSMARAGYPCEIELPGNTKWFCEDKRGLEHALAELLQDPMVGETIQNYMRL